MASLETWMGLRYLRAKKRNGFMSFYYHDFNRRYRLGRNGADCGFIP